MAIRPTGTSAGDPLAAAGAAYRVSSPPRGPDGKREGGAVALPIDLLDTSRPRHSPDRRLVPQDHRAMGDGNRTFGQGTSHRPRSVAQTGDSQRAARRYPGAAAFPPMRRSARHLAQRADRPGVGSAGLGRRRRSRGTAWPVARLSPHAGRYRRRRPCRPAACHARCT
jgi:hypothetical protein